MKDEGYRFVPVPKSARRVRRDEARHDRRMSGAITARVALSLVTEQPLHVGSGFKTLIEGAVVRQALTSSGTPCVPGSTLKGVLRSRFEAITRSCSPLDVSERPKRVRSSSFPNAEARFDRAVVEHDVFRRCSQDRLCAACALFGRMSLRGRVIVSDFLAGEGAHFSLGELPEMFSPNLHHVGEFTPTQGDRMLVVRTLHGRKFARGSGPESANREKVEVLAPGATLTGDLRVQNVTLAEFGGLVAALGHRPSSRLKVGAGKGHGFGRMRVERFEVHVHGGAAAVAPDLDACERAFLASEDLWREGLDALVSMHGGDC